MSAGILPSGFCCRTVSLGFMVSAGSIMMSRSVPSTLAAIRILRTKGEEGELRSFNTINSIQCVAIDDRRRAAAPAGDARSRNGGRVRPSAGDDEVDGLRTLALL